ncbi:MAG TPA: peptide ABC transporter substrate-binding protein [Aliidongia sp.]|uniref:peptide ABC transporter substrate-binding protein n=1 Tax=Aliidongia sp. TaxID=1914230 RepID=UPI002DDCD85D|nr:peptide ABC transporter substrate-binding protein [Aliidongia sp.]HEV2675715.1 peptide ABC transporter substrate-binding protein [Aliidongia sp.]
MITLSTLCLAATHEVAGAATILKRASQVEPETLDPHKSSGGPEQNIEMDLFEGLTTYDAGARPVPGVADRWETSADGLVWTFHLRPDARWSDGTPVTADDFVAAFQRLVAPATASPSAQMFDVLENATRIIAGAEKNLAALGAAAIDPTMLRLTLEHPMPLLPNLLATAAAAPINRAALAKFADQWSRPGNLVSNGAYVLTSWAPQSELVLKRNAAYREAAGVAFDEIHWVVVEDDQTALKRYRAGELDISRVPAGELDWAKRTIPNHLHLAPQLAVVYLAINMRMEPLASNLKLRTALSMAIDRRVLSDKVEPAGEIAAYGFITGGVEGYEPQTLSYKEMNEADRLAAARKLYEESGAGKGGPLKLSIVYQTDRDKKRILLAIAAMWKDCCGIELTLVNREWQVYLANLRERDFQIAYDQINGSYADAYDLLSGYRTAAGELNDAGYANPTFDVLLEKASGTVDAVQRAKLLGRAEQVLIDDAAVLPLNFPVYRAIVSPRLRGWEENVLNFHPSRFLSFAP